MATGPYIALESGTHSKARFGYVSQRGPPVSKGGPCVGRPETELALMSTRAPLRRTQG
jgi:hypothetical protein